MDYAIKVRKGPKIDCMIYLENYIGDAIEVDEIIGETDVSIGYQLVTIKPIPNFVYPYEQKFVKIKCGIITYYKLDKKIQCWSKEKIDETIENNMKLIPELQVLTFLKNMKDLLPKVEMK